MKGQMSFVNMFAVFITLWIYMTLLYPIMDDAVQTLVLDLQANPTEFSEFMIILVQLSPLVLLIGILMTVWVYATPRQETYYRGV